ncbi:MAG TPA: hypothetical protein VNS79_01000 [Sphingobium sp.]|nr:hypothetical protein [Sphingobium sp.]
MGAMHAALSARAAISRTNKPLPSIGAAPFMPGGLRHPSIEMLLFQMVLRINIIIALISHPGSGDSPSRIASIAQRRNERVWMKTTLPWRAMFFHRVVMVKLA